LAAEIVFYRLNRKVVHNRDAIPEDARQVMYYSLMIGHHVGVMDCFSELMAVPAAQYGQLLDAIGDLEARAKLEGALKWTEIEINRSHVDSLLPALRAALPQLNGSTAQWARTFAQCLREMLAEPALYLMLKVRS
jgi:hypothetical protein